MELIPLVACPAIGVGKTVEVGWHSISCACQLCLTVDEKTVGISAGWGWSRIHTVEWTEHPYWGEYSRKVYAGGYRPPPEKE